jgi:hypothetical protein
MSFIGMIVGRFGPGARLRSGEKEQNGGAWP